MATSPGSADRPVFVQLTPESVDDLKKALLPEPKPEPGDDGSDHFTRIVAPFLAGFTLSLIVQLATSPVESSPVASSVTATSLLPSIWPWRDMVLVLFVVATGLLLAGFQLSIGSLYKNRQTSILRPVLAFAGVACVTAGLILLTLERTIVIQWAWIIAALTVLGLGLAIPIIVRMVYWWREVKGNGSTGVARPGGLHRPPPALTS